MPPMKYIGLMTSGVRDLVMVKPELFDKLAKAFSEAARGCDDYFYTLQVEGKKFFAVDNGEDGYTLMLPEEY